MSTSLEHVASSCCGVREGHCAAVMGIVWWGGHPRCSTHGNWWKPLPSCLIIPSDAGTRTPKHQKHLLHFLD